MAFAIKIDYCNLVEALKNGSTPTLKLRDSKLGGSEQKYQPNGRDGSFDVATEIYGPNMSPTNAYGLCADISASAGAIKLGKFVSITFGAGSDQYTKKFALEKVSISTGSAAAVTINAEAKEIEDEADESRQPYYSIPAFNLETKQEAQDIFGAFTIGDGDNLHLIKCDAEIACTVKPDDVAGVKISSDVNSGLITVTGTILSGSGVTPVVTANTGDIDLGDGLISKWIVTQNPAIREENLEKAKKQYTFAVELPLKKFRPTAGVTLTNVRREGHIGDSDIFKFYCANNYGGSVNVYSVVEGRNLDAVTAIKVESEDELAGNHTLRIVKKTNDSIIFDVGSAGMIPDATYTFVLEYGSGQRVTHDGVQAV